MCTFPHRHKRVHVSGTKTNSFVKEWDVLVAESWAVDKNNGCPPGGTELDSRTYKVASSSPSETPGLWD